MGTDGSGPAAAISAYLVLLRGVNVGGRNKVPMAALRQCLLDTGFSDVTTYIASGNVLLRSAERATTVRSRIEQALTAHFQLDDDTVQALVLGREQLRAVIDNKPVGFGEQPEKFHSDAIFLIGIDPDEAIAVFDPRDGVDAVWPGDGVIYSQRLSAQRTRSRLSKIMGSPLYRSMTIRSWNTTSMLWTLMQKMEPS